MDMVYENICFKTPWDGKWAQNGVQSK